jgi:hypothetical protein
VSLVVALLAAVAPASIPFALGPSLAVDFLARAIYVARGAER